MIAEQDFPTTRCSSKSMCAASSGPNLTHDQCTDELQSDIVVRDQTTIAAAFAELDRRTQLANTDYADLRMDLEELAQENAELRDQLGRSEDRRHEP